MITSERIKEYAKEVGADLVGVAPIERFKNAPKENNPVYIMPRAKSVIGLGFRIHRGIFRGVEEQTFYSGYTLMGFSNINDYFAPIVLRKLSNLLEDSGYEALPYHDRSTHFAPNKGRPASPDKPAPDVFLNFRISAVLCGMGEIGYSNLFLSPEFGPAQRLAFIITEAKLEPDPIYKGRICDGCKECMKQCPCNAISKEKDNEVVIEEKHMPRAKIDTYKCAMVANSGTKEISPFISDEVAEVMERIKNGEHLDINMWEYLAEKVPYVGTAVRNYGHAAGLCVGKGCFRACLNHLEKTEALTRKFHLPFRESNV